MKSQKVRDFIKETERLVQSEEKLLNWSIGEAKAEKKEYIFPVDEYYKAAWSTLALRKIQAVGAEAGAAAQDVLFNFFSLMISRKAPAEYSKTLAEACLRELLLFDTVEQEPVFVRGYYLKQEYAIERKVFGAETPAAAVFSPALHYLLYKNGKQLADLSFNQLRALKKYFTQDADIFEKLAAALQKKEEFPVIQEHAFEASYKSIAAAIHCTLRYEVNRKALLDFFEKKEWPLAFKKCTKYRIARTKGQQRIGYDIYTTIPHLLAMISQPEFSYTLKLLAYAEAPLAAAKLAQTVAVPFSYGFESEMHDIISFLKEQQLNLSEWQPLAAEETVCSIKEMPAIAAGETFLAEELF